jgi:methionyl-tRNA synthetase
MTPNNQERLTITSALPYIHGVPHLGNIVGSILPADIFHRYNDIKGIENVFICGSDVHGTPLELEAIEREVSPEELTEEQHQKVKDVLEEFNMDFSIYSNTHSEYNRKQTHDMFIELYTNDYIKEKKQNLPYCKNDERFLPDRYIEGECPHCSGLARGDQCDDCGKLVEPEEIINPECQICGGQNIEFRDTTHLAIDLNQFEEELLDWVSSDPSPVPEHKVKQVENLIKEAEDRTITRDQEWGFKIPVEKINKRIEEEGLEVEKLETDKYSSKRIYVWFDAPIAYIGFTRELFEDNRKWKDYWVNDRSKNYYSIGKDNTIFHTVIFPSILIGASTDEEKYNLPHYEFIQDFLMAEDTQFSKSRGKGLSTTDALEMYPVDYWRFYLASNLPQEHDTKFSWDGFESRINNVLNDTVGNFVNRTLSLSEQWFDNKVPVSNHTQRDEEVIREAEELVDSYEEAFENHDIQEALENALDLARLGDQYLSEEEPWNNEDRRTETINVAIQIIRGLGVTLYPFIPSTSEKIAKMLNTEIHTEEGFDELLDPLLGGIESGHELGEREILFEKIDTEEKRAEDEMKDEEKHNLNTDTVSFEEFGDMDIRVGEVQKAEEHPNADKLYKIQVEVDEGVTLQTCAGLKNHYSKDELEGLKVVVLANLEPAELRGEKSECMMLAAEDDEGNVSLLETGKEMKIGSKIK